MARRYQRAGVTGGAVGYRQGRSMSRGLRSAGLSSPAGVLVPETLTESFCERCGARFTFEPAAKPKHLGRLRMLSRGLRGYVLTDGESFGDAMEHARSDEERRQANVQLDRFHDTFKFCMSCRQYTCGSCWNVAAGQCLSCAPIASAARLPSEDARLEVEELAPPPAGVPGTAAWAPIAEVAALASVTPDVPVAPAATDEGAGAQSPDPFAPAREPSRTPTPDVDDVSVDLLARLGLGPHEERRTTPVDRSAFGRLGAWSRRVDGTTIGGNGAPTRAESTSPRPAAPMERRADDAAPDALRSTADEGVTARLETPAPLVDDALAHGSSPDPDAGTAEGVDAAQGLMADAAPDDAADPATSVQPASTGSVPSLESSPPPDVAVESEPAAAIEAAPAPDERMEAAPTPAPVAQSDAAVQSVPIPMPPAAPAPAPAPAPATPAPAPAPALAPATAAAGSESVWWIVAPDGQAKPGVDATVQPTWPNPVSRQTVPLPSPAPSNPVGPLRPAAPPLSMSPVWPTLPPAQAPRPVHAPKVASSDVVWAASSRDVLNRPGTGAQACVACGLALSASARFCRRCGSPQH